MLGSANELHYFLELTNTLNFSRAAQRAGISQPSLSVAIKRLENKIGTTLFIRHKHGVSLTHAGKRLLAHSKQLLQLWDNVRAASLASHHQVQGSFSLGCHAAIASYLLPKFLPKLLIDYPQLEIQLKHDISRKILENVITLAIDIGIVVNPIKHPDLIIQKLYSDKFTLWENPAKKPTLPIIFCDPALMQSQWLLKKLAVTSIKNYRLIASTSFEVIANLTAQGSGLGMLPTSIAQTFSMQLKPLSAMPVYNDEVCLVYRPENRLIKAVQTIIQHIKNNCQRN